MRALRLVLLTCMTAAVLLLPPLAHAATEYRVVGRGWGHGIGMSQYGAKAFAERGYHASQIITYYYQGSKVAAAPAGTGTMRVLLVEGRSEVQLRAASDKVTITRGNSSHQLKANDVVTARTSGGKTTVVVLRGGTTSQLFGPGTQTITVSGPAGSIVTRFTALNGRYGHTYRGALLIHQVGSTLSVVNRVGLEPYLYGVLPGEMPSSWPTAALQAQAIAARSYALATRRTSGIFDAWADTRSQMYMGMQDEQTTTTAAVNATAKQVAMHSGAIVPGFFFSTSGGRTASVEHVWGSEPRPYLKTMPDPYEKSPYSRWPEHRPFTPAGLAKHFDGYLAGSFRGVRVPVNGSLRAASVQVVGSGGTRTMPATVFQARLGLRSTWFRIERLSIVAARKQVTAGQQVRLSGRVPKGGTTTLHARQSGTSSWQLVGRVRPGTGGAWDQVVRVNSTTRYRLKRGGRWGPAVSVTVG